MNNEPNETTPERNPIPSDTLLRQAEELAAELRQRNPDPDAMKIIEIAADIVCAFSSRVLECEKRQTNLTSGGISPQVVPLNDLERELYHVAIVRLRGGLRVPDVDLQQLGAGLISAEEFARRKQLEAGTITAEEFAKGQPLGEWDERTRTFLPAKKEETS